ncbi:complex I NDUFA9 subunit family protein [Alicyclobacillus fodiniaquatilis]|uniref:Complex I NDUFA9 subunit family protein n=1 Tax=Alicyclobacillus fodiniaquatilis TaxID=1661150 RepID=A0ABW4JES7_9BACL
MKVFVTGGTGYVGQPVVRALLKHGHAVRLLRRRGGRPMELSGSLQEVEGDLSNISTLCSGMQGVDAIIHLVGIIREDKRRGVTMHGIHADGTAHVIEAARQVGISRIIHMSALGARPSATSTYHRSKWEAETLIRQSGMSYTVFRPSIVFGAGGPGPNFITELAAAIRKAPFVPIIGDGSSLLQPVHINTVASVFAQALEKDETIGETFEVGGPEVVMYEEIVEKITDRLNTRKPTVHIPLAVMEQLVKVLGWMPAFPLTADQLTMLREGNVCSAPNRLYDTFDVAPIPFSIPPEQLST